MSIIKKVRKRIEKAIVKLEAAIDEGKVSEGFERARTAIYTDFEEAERDYMLLEDKADSLLSVVIKSKYSILIVIAYGIAWAAVGYGITLI